MQIETCQIVTVTEANQNFSRATKIADKCGQAVIFKNNRPQYVLVSLADNPILDLTHEEKVDIIAARVLKKYRRAFEELAK